MSAGKEGAPVWHEVTHVCAQSGARLGVLHTPHGGVDTPSYMPVGTQAVVKAMTSREMRELGAQIVLANTYHLSIRPGEDLVRRAGGLHGFMAWDRPILTDSGGFQVFSLASLRKITEEGVSFRSHLDGSPLFMGPEQSMQVQEALGADVIMAFDVCTPWPAEKDRARADMERTHRWARRCLDAHRRGDQALFGIVQGGVFADLRRESAEALSAMGFPGYGIGGLSVGEPKELMYEMLDATVPYLPQDKPRYLMGVGTPDCLLEGVLRGVDMFACVLATRIARNGTVLTAQGRLVIRNARYKDDLRPIEEGCDCEACRDYSRAYVRHLINTREITGARLCSIHNLRYLARLMEGARAAIREDRFLDYMKDFYARFDMRGAFNRGDGEQR